MIFYKIIVLLYIKYGKNNLCYNKKAYLELEMKHFDTNPTPIRVIVSCQNIFNLNYSSNRHYVFISSNDV